MTSTPTVYPVRSSTFPVVNPQSIRERVPFHVWERGSTTLSIDAASLCLFSSSLSSRPSSQPTVSSAISTCDLTSAQHPPFAPTDLFLMSSSCAKSALRSASSNPCSGRMRPITGISYTKSCSRPKFSSFATGPVSSQHGNRHVLAKTSGRTTFGCVWK